MTDKPEVIEAEPTEEITVVSREVMTSPERAIADLEARQELAIRRRQIAIKMTKREDWKEMGNTMYLQKTGSDRIMSSMGLLRRIIEGPIKDIYLSNDEEVYEVRYRVALCERAPDGTIIDLVQEDGSCDSRDDFFSKYKEQGVMKRKRLEEIDRTNIDAKALTTAYNRAIRSLFALNGLTMQDLNTLGLTGFQKIDYGESKTSGKSGGKGSTSSNQKAPAIPEDLPDVPDSVEGMKGWSDQALVGVWLREIKRAKAEYDVFLDELFLDGLKGEPGYWKMNQYSANKMTPKRRDWFRAKLIEAVTGYPPIEQINDESAGDPADEGEINEDDIPRGGSAE